MNCLLVLLVKKKTKNKKQIVEYDYYFQFGLRSFVVRTKPNHAALPPVVIVVVKGLYSPERLNIFWLVCGNAIHVIHVTDTVASISVPWLTFKLNCVSFSVPTVFGQSKSTLPGKLRMEIHVEAIVGPETLLCADTFT